MKWSAKNRRELFDAHCKILVSFSPHTDTLIVTRLCYTSVRGLVSCQAVVHVMITKFYPLQDDTRVWRQHTLLFDNSLYILKIGKQSGQHSHASVLSPRYLMAIHKDYEVVLMWFAGKSTISVQKTIDVAIKHNGRARVLFTAFLPSCYEPFKQTMLLECKVIETYAGWFISAELEASSVWDKIWQQVSHVPLLCER